MFKYNIYRLSAIAIAGLFTANILADVPLPNIEHVNKSKIKCFCNADKTGKFYSVRGERLVRTSVSDDEGSMIKLALAEEDFRSETKTVGNACKDQRYVTCWAKRRYFSVAGGNSITPNRIPYCEKYGTTMGSGDCKKRP